MPVSFSNPGASQSISLELSKIAMKSASVQAQTITGKRNNTPQEEPTNQALYAQSMATCAALKGGVNNANQAVKYFNVAGSSMGASKDMLIACQEFCVQANNSLTDPASRQTLQDSLEGILGKPATPTAPAQKGSFMSGIDQTVWMNQKILAGGTVVGPTPAVSVAVVPAVQNLVAPPIANTFAAALINGGDCLGSYSGTVSAASVTQNATTPANFDVKITVGTSIYSTVAAGVAAAANGEWRLNGDNGSIITLSLAAVVAGTTANMFDTSLKTALGLIATAPAVAVPAVFVTGSTVAQSALFTIAATKDLPSGTYSIGVGSPGINPAAAPWTMSVSNGTAGSSLTAAIGANSFFGGALKITYLAAPAAAVANYTFTIENYAPFQCQTGATATDVLTGKLPKVDLTSLGIANDLGQCNLNLLTMEGATIASKKITAALDKLNGINSNIGTLQAQSTSAALSSATLLINVSDAATVYDAVDAPGVIGATIELSIRSKNATGAIMPAYTTQRQLSNELDSANKLIVH